MWPSFETATSLAMIAKFGLVGSLGVGVTATVVFVWMSMVKETHYAADREMYLEHITRLDDDTRRLSAEAESARSRIAIADAKVAQAAADMAIADERSAALKAEAEAARSQTALIASQAVQASGEAAAANERLAALQAEAEVAKHQKGLADARAAHARAEAAAAIERVAALRTRLRHVSAEEKRCAPEPHHKHTPHPHGK